MASRRAIVAVAVLLAVALVAPLRVAAPGSRVPRVGIVTERTPPDPRVDAFRRALADLGYVEGRNVIVEVRYARGAPDHGAALMAELLRLNVDVLVVGGTLAAQAAKAQTTAVPIVFVLAGDPVGSRLVASLSRPGGNATGLSNVVAELGGKQLELLRAAVPGVTRIGIVRNPLNPASAAALKEAQDAARRLGVEVHVAEVRRRADVPDAFAALAGWRAGAVLAISDAMVGGGLLPLSQVALDNRLPTMYANRDFVDAGGFMSYGPNFTANYQRAAAYVDKILKGAKPADLPVQQPTTFELALNLKTARALGITVPASLVARADHVIR